MIPSTPAPSPDPGGPQDHLAAGANDGTSASEEITVKLPDEAPAVTPLVAAALLRLLRNAQRHANNKDSIDRPDSRSAA